jgi:hypothetical protein
MDDTRESRTERLAWKVGHERQQMEERSEAPGRTPQAMLHCFAIVVSSFLLCAPSAFGQSKVVFVGIAGSACSFSTAAKDASAPEFMVSEKKYWASGFIDGAYAALGMGISRSSVNFVYARLQNYCADHPDTTLRDAMQALVGEDMGKATKSAATSEQADSTEPPKVIFRPAVFRLNPPTWVLWVYSSGDWQVVTSDSVDFGPTVERNLAYFETSVDCQAVRAWMAGLPKGNAVKDLTMSFQCYPSNFDPRTKK